MHAGWRYVLVGQSRLPALRKIQQNWPLFPWKCQQQLYNQHSLQKDARAPLRAARLQTCSITAYLQHLKASLLKLLRNNAPHRAAATVAKELPRAGVLTVAHIYELSFWQNDLRPRLLQPRRWWPKPSTWKFNWFHRKSALSKKSVWKMNIHTGSNVLA